MGDIADKAAVSDELFHKSSLANHFDSIEKRSQHIYKGVVICIDCEDPIPEERLKLLPDCIRCVECQELYEWECKCL